MSKSKGVMDFRKSCIVTVGPINSAKFIPESRCIISDSTNGPDLEFIQCASCKSENTFSHDKLFTKNNYDFTPVFGRDLTSVIFRRFSTHNSQHYRQVGNMNTQPFLNWGRPHFHIEIANPCELLSSPEKIIEETQRGACLIVQTEFANADRGLRAVLEYPVKTINTDKKNKVFQIDTGPIIFPDIWNIDADARNSLILCYIAFNNLERCEIIVESPISILENSPLSIGDGQNPEIERYFLVDHYSDIRSIDATHRIYSA